VDRVNGNQVMWTCVTTASREGTGNAMNSAPSPASGQSFHYVSIHPGSSGWSGLQLLLAPGRSYFMRAISE